VPKPYHHGDLRRVVLEAALEDVAESEAIPLNFNRLAKRIGVSHTAIYRHFPDKQSLIDALALHAFEALEEAVATAVARAGEDPRRRISAGLRAYIDVAVARPVYLRLMFSGVTTDRAQAPDLKSAAGKAIGHLQHEIGVLAERGELPAESVVDATRVLWASTHGLAQLLADSQLIGMVRTPAGVDHLVTLMLETLAGDGAGDKA